MGSDDRDPEQGIVGMYGRHKYGDHWTQTLSPYRMSLRTIRQQCKSERLRTDHDRPTHYGECLERGLGTAGPCPYVGCKYHLYTNPTKPGQVQITIPERDPDECPDTCALAVASRGHHTLKQIGERMGCTKEWVRQQELSAIRKIKKNFPDLYDKLFPK